MDSLRGVMRRVADGLRHPLTGWAVPSIAIVLPMLALTGIFLAYHSLVIPGIQFSSSLFVGAVVLITVCLYTVRYRTTGFSFDAITAVAFLSAFLFSSFSAYVADIMLRGGTSTSSFYMSQMLEHISFVVVGGVLLAGVISRATVRKIGRIELATWLITVVLLTGITAAALGLVALGSAQLFAIEASSLEDYIHITGLLMALAAGAALFRDRIKLFRNSYNGLLLFVILQGMMMVVGLTQDTQYTYGWYVDMVVISQAYLFPLWGLLIDYLNLQSRNRRMSGTIEEAGNWMLRTMISPGENNSILGTVSRNFRSGEAFSFLSTDGVEWTLEDTSSLNDTGLERMARQMRVDLREFGGTEGITVISDSDRTERSETIRRLLQSSFLATVARIQPQLFRLVGIRERDRILWLEEERRFIWLLTGMQATSSMARYTLDRRAETVSQLLAMVQTTRILTRLEEDPSRNYDEVVAAMVEMLDYENSSIWQVDTDGTMKPLAWRTLESIRMPFDPKATLRMGYGVVGRAAAELKPVYAADTSKEIGYLNLFGEITRSEYAYPVIVDDRCFAVLDVQSSKLNAFESIDQEVINTVGRLLSLSTTLRRLYSSMSESRKIAEARSGLIAHDLRNILQALTTHIELIRLKMSKSGVQAMDIYGNLDELRTGISNAHRFLEEVLTISKLEAGKIGTVRDYDVRDFIESSYRLLTETFPAKKLDLKITGDGAGVDYMIKGTEFVRDVFMNLFSNSAKYTDGEGVLLEVGLSRETEGSGNYVMVNVSDRGRGIEPERAREVFNRFNKGASGTGLGLPLVKQIMESIGGSISISERVEGDYTRGTTFHLRFPAADHSIPAYMHAAEM